mmetsp:Transcript_34158/g.106993  ORF Transcript_34158/g.106993 Transcript_34158/m.106993 type:complete len:264 (-) Transcript_34158:629-1420(-)
MTLQSRVHHEGSTRWIHSTQELNILNDSQLQLRHIIPVLVIHVLTEQRDGILSFIWIKLGHIQIIHKVDQAHASRGTIVSSSLLLERGFKHRPEATTISVVVEVHSERHEVFAEASQFAVDHGGLASTSKPDQQSRISELNMQIEEEGYRLSLASGYSHRVHRYARFVHDLWHYLRPWGELTGGLVHKKVIDHPLCWQFHSSPFRFPPVAEIFSHVYSVCDCETSPEGPYCSEDKVCFNDGSLVRHVFGNILTGQQTVQDPCQ